MSASDNSRNVLLIAGATASGKSALALDLAHRLNGIIINADALQVYGPLRILSARPLPDEEARVPHRLYGHVAGDQRYSVAQWLDEAVSEIEAAWRQGRRPIVVGGTGLYFRALEQGLSPIPEIPDAVRKRWRLYEGDLHHALQKLDPSMAARLAHGDRQRLTRALEVIEGTGRSLLDWQREEGPPPPLAGALVERLFMEVPRDELYARAELRFDQMMRAGALEEVRAVAGLDPSLPMMKAIGVPELLRHLEGGIPLEQAVADAKTATRNFIKRQLTWWRGQRADWREHPAGEAGAS
jgi:tRNA dimethylallyltransferase